MSSVPNPIPATISTLRGDCRGLARRARIALPLLVSAIAVLFALSPVAACGGGADFSVRSVDRHGAVLAKCPSSSNRQVC